MKYITLLLLFMGSNAFGKTIFYGSETESIPINRYTTTILRFDHEVKTISQAENFEISPADVNNPNYSLLSIKPRSSRGGVLTFFLGNEAIVSLKFRVISKRSLEGIDSFYDFKDKKEKIGTNERSPEGINVTDLQLMKAMIRNDTVSGYKSRPLARNVRTKVDGIKARLIKIYTGPKFNGYIFKISNNSDAPYHLDLSQLNLGEPNLALLSQADHIDLDEKQPHTLLRIVAKPTSAYRSISLPIRVAKQK